MIDLHIHTSHSSDGQYTPADIFSLAKRCGLTALAFCDHMDIAAAAEGMDLAPRESIEFFTGVELSTTWEEREYHLLCYGFDPGSPAMQEFITHNCALAWANVDAILTYFRDLGFLLRAEEVSGWGKSVPTGVTMLKALVRCNPDDAGLHRYTHGDRSDSPYLNFYQDFSLSGFGKTFSSEFPSLKKTIEEMKEHGVLVLAHPGRISRDALLKLKGYGLQGVEVYSTHHTPETILYVDGLARSLCLFASAGSDFHGEKIKPDISLGNVAGKPDPALIEAVRGSMAAWHGGKHGSDGTG